MNKVILVGRLTADPILKQTQSGISSCRFTVAADRKFADKNTGERQADFINCIAWKQTSEFVNRYFSKGRMIVVEGTLRNNNYKDRQHPDVTHYTMDVLVDNIEFAGDKAANNNQQQSAQYAQAAQPVSPQEQAQANDQLSYGSLSDFEEILSDGDVPF